MEENKIMTHFIKGVIISLIVIILGIAGYFMDLTDKSWFGWVSNGVLFIAIIWACIYYAQQKEGYVTFGNVFSHGFKTSAICALILTAYALLAFTVIFPEMKDKIIETAQRNMEEKGNMTDEQIEQAMDMTRRYFTPFTVGFTLIGTLIFGCIASLIGAAVAKKKPINPMDQMN